MEANNSARASRSASESESDADSERDASCLVNILFHDLLKRLHARIGVNTSPATSVRRKLRPL